MGGQQVTGEIIAYTVLVFGHGFVAALWLHDPIVRCVRRAVDRAMAKREAEK